MIVAIGTALAAHHYFKQSECQKDQMIIQNALTTLSRFRADATIIKRERNKTGLSISEQEYEFLNQIDFLMAQFEETESDLLSMLSNRKKLTPEFRSEALAFIASVNRFSTDLQVISSRFQNFNNNRVGELHKLQAILKKLESLNFQ